MWLHSPLILEKKTLKCCILDESPAQTWMCLQDVFLSPCLWFVVVFFLFIIFQKEVIPSPFESDATGRKSRTQLQASPTSV